MNLSHNETQFFNTWSIADNSDVKTALIYLNDKLNQITRQVTFWDVYNVTQVLLSDSDLVSKLPLLNRGESAIVNANVLTNGNQTRYRGDIAYRMMDGNIQWIDAENKGIYKPHISYDSTTGMLKVTYSYHSAISEEEETEEVVFDNQVQIGYVIDAPLTAFTNNSYSFSKKIADNNTLKPIIKFYYKDGTSLEELYCSYHWAESGNNIVVTLDCNCANIASSCYMRVR